MTNYTKKQQKIRQTFTQNDQGHIFQFIDDLDEAHKNFLFNQISQIDLASVRREVLKLTKPHQQAPILKPATTIKLPSNNTDAVRWQQARTIGEQAIQMGKIAVVTVAGGQGTRLGFDHSKGMFPVTPVKNKSLFQLFAEKIRACELRYHCKIHWFIMTSPLNHEETLQYFTENRFFGLTHVDIHPQGLLPTVDIYGKLLLSSRHSIAMNPDGHGGLLRALGTSGILEKWEHEGIEHISYFQVDNPMISPMDPAFIGFHLMEKSQVSSRCVKKAYADEKVGIFAEVNQKLAVVEYSDLPVEAAHAMDISGNLRFGLANIATHIFSIDFIRPFTVEEQWNSLPLHRALKRVSYINELGNLVIPAEPNAIKLERFIFDILPLAEKTLLLEGKRDEIFSPVKNLAGIDSIETSKRDQNKLFSSWLSAAKADIPMDLSGVPPFSVEISPLFADSKDEFLAKWQLLPIKPVVSENFYMG